MIDVLDFGDIFICLDKITAVEKNEADAGIDIYVVGRNHPIAIKCSHTEIDEYYNKVKKALSSAL